jgi:signal transduction histidine kinase/DNA-binding NarL/FixJ family response regulator
MDSQSIKVLLIEDNSGDARLIQELVKEAATTQFELTHVSRLTTGLQCLVEEAFDVLLLDLGLPDSQGLDTFLQTQTQAPDIPIVVLSGLDSEALALEAVREGAQDYLVKGRVDGNLLTRALRYAVERKRAEKVLRQRNRELAALNRVSCAISDLLDLDAMLHRAIDAAMAAIEADGGAVRLLNPATQQLVIAVTRGLSETYQCSARAVPCDVGTVGQVAWSGHPYIERDLTSDPWLASLSENDGFGSYLCVPLRTGQRIVGTLEMVTISGRDFSSREVELVTSIGNQIGLAVARAQYATELARANADLRRLDTLREQFIQNVAHELRTPLALVHGYIQVLEQGDLSEAEQQMALGVVARRIKSLVDLVHSITTLQDLGSQPLHMERVKPAELVSTAIRMAAQRANSAKVSVKDTSPQDMPSFPGDFTRLTQALHQLLDNACKFSPEGSIVTVTTQITPDTMLFSVKDQGIGIPPEEQDYIFERFYQADGSSRRRYGGTGLGLAIAREICEAHGGRLTVRNGQNQGSIFTMHLPCKTGSEIAIHQASAPLRDLVTIANARSSL